MSMMQRLNLTNPLRFVINGSSRMAIPSTSQPPLHQPHKSISDGAGVCLTAFSKWQWLTCVLGRTKNWILLLDSDHIEPVSKFRDLSQSTYLMLPVGLLRMSVDFSCDWSFQWLHSSFDHYIIVVRPGLNYRSYEQYRLFDS
uniref:Uncharacterized protein n=1 Tax=Salix viminalis TaxID=40686 RepID=A0A6N2L297_SALVM